MYKKFLTLPIDAEKFLKNREFDKCGLKESIIFNIHLINTTYFGECSFDETFGCAIWDIDFDNLSSTNRIRNRIIESLSTSLKSHEKRLSDISVDVKIRQEELIYSKQNILVKKKVIIRIKGKIRKTNEDFYYQDIFYIGPLSY
ncbi:MAG: hypothetical protein CR968_01805 [Flavobacteriia bacterium]|nr:MAG: hypothetical protein CR968_01805 [Flavobacteriia bacterium]